jgi:hypothetical protein
MKQLVVKALAEHFEKGATVNEMIDFFRDAWGRDVTRQSLSPQLSRLLRDGSIAHGDGRKWILPERHHAN